MILDMMFYDIILEAKASEHSSRMIAMKNAKDNAKKIAGALTLKYNKARQSMITREVSEITAGVESMKD
jgi:F-type H+-transporting ATPase subunit gamma